MKYTFRSIGAGSAASARSISTVTGTGLREASDSSPAARPRSCRIGGANPRESARSSSRASRAWSRASPTSAFADSGS